MFQLRPLVTAIAMIGLVSNEVAVAANDWLSGVAVDGVLKIMAGYSKDYADKDASDIIVHTAILGITAKPNEWTTGRLTYKYEENKTPLSVDDAYIVLGNLDKSPGYLKMGQFVVPFGNFTSHMNSDPLTLVMGETVEKAVLLGFEMNGAYASIFSFNGATNEDTNDTIDHFGARAGFAKKMEKMSFDVGASYLSDIGDTGTISAKVPNGPNTAYDYVDGLGVHLVANMGPAFLIGEYIMALDNFKKEHFAYKGEGAEPQAWNLEAGLTFNTMGQNLTLAVGYQGTDEAVGLKDPRSGMQLPASRILGTVAMEIYKNTTVSLEYAVDEDYDVEDGGTGEDAESASLVLALKF
jgi:hypothetical protein